MDNVQTKMRLHFYGLNTAGYLKSEVEQQLFMYLNQVKKQIQTDPVFPIFVDQFSIDSWSGTPEDMTVSVSFNTMYEDDIFEESPIHNWLENLFGTTISIEEI